MPIRTSFAPLHSLSASFHWFRSKARVGGAPAASGWSGTLRLLALVAALAVSCLPAAAATATAVTLAITPGTSVSSKTAVTLTATVKAGATAVTIGTVLLCDANATYCTDVHVLGAAQTIVTAGATQGTAVFKFIPGVGTHSYKAVYVANSTYAASTSSNVSLTVTQSGTVGSQTTIAQSGSAGSYTLTSTTSGFDTPYPSDTVSFLDATNSNAVVATAGVTSNANNPAFTGNRTYSVGQASESGVTADFNGDGIPDLAVESMCPPAGCSGASTTGGPIYILLGNGDGTFRSGTTLAGYTTLLDVKAGDFNRDGKIDLVTVTENNVSGPPMPGGNAYQEMQVFLGNGDGTFQSPSQYNLPLDVGYIAVADMNNDGFLDVVVTGEEANGLTLYFGNGNGGFTSSTSSATIGIGTDLVVAAPFAGSGAPDLGMALISADNYLDVRLYKNNGSGSFTALPTITIPNSGTATWISFADVTGDGLLDLLVADATNNVLLVYRGAGNGTFTLLSTMAAGSGADFVGTADFNNDGNADIFVQNYNDSTYTIFTGNGTGSFTKATGAPPTGSGPYFAVAADFNEDGRPDLASVNYNDNTVSTVLNQSISTATATGVNVIGASTTHAVKASYPGDSYYGASASGTTSLTGTRVSTTLGLSANPTTSNFGQQVSLTATLSPYSGDGVTTDGETISFYIGSVSVSNLLGTGTLSSGLATLNTTALPQGNDTIYAVYTQDASNFGGSQKTLAFTVATAAADATSTVVTLTSSSVTVGDTLMLKATVSDTTHTGTTPTGSVTFTDKLGGTTSTIGPIALSGGLAQTTYSAAMAGSHTITATYSPSNSATFSTSADTTGKTLTIAQAALTPYGQSEVVAQGASTIIVVNFAYPGTIAPTGAVTFLLNGSSANLSGQTCVYKSKHSNCDITYTAPANMTPGVYTVTYSQAQDANYLAQSGTLNMTVVASGQSHVLAPRTVQQGLSTLLVAHIDNPAAVPRTGAMTFLVNGSSANLSDLRCVERGSESLCTVAYDAANTPKGSYTMTYEQAGDASHSAVRGSAQLKVQ